MKLQFAKMLILENDGGKKVISIFKISLPTYEIINEPGCIHDTACVIFRQMFIEWTFER